MVINKTFAEKFVENRYENKGVRRIVCVDNVKTLAKENEHRKKEAGEHGITVFPYVSQETIGIRRRPIAQDPHAVHCFAERLSLVGRADDGHTIARCG
jgi:hypothetical protein